MIRSVGYPIPISVGADGAFRILKDGLTIYSGRSTTGIVDIAPILRDYLNGDLFDAGIQLVTSSDKTAYVNNPIVIAQDTMLLITLEDGTPIEDPNLIKITVIVSEEVTDSVMDINPQSLSLSYNDTTAKSIQVTTSITDWSASTTDSWLTVSKISNTEAQVTVTSNSGTTDRNGRVTFSGIDTNGQTVSRELTVLQYATQDDPVINVTVIVTEEIEQMTFSPTTYQFPYVGGEITVTANNLSGTLTIQSFNPPNDTYNLVVNGNTFTLSCGQRINPYPISDTRIYFYSTLGQEAVFTFRQL